MSTGPPPYPRYPAGTAPGTSIGSFVIGASQIGDVPPFDVWSTVLSQYSNSPILTQLITNMGQYLDPTANIDAFFDSMFDVLTAVGYGLDCCGRIVGVSRILPATAPGGFLGFDEAGSPLRTGFGQGQFFGGQSAASNFVLLDPQFRILVLAKALANICDGSIPAINQLLLNLFPGQGACYVTEGALSMTYTFTFPLTPVQLSIVQNSGVLPRTSGVSVSVVHP
jgi:hypothetical protein